MMIHALTTMIKQKDKLGSASTLLSTTTDNLTVTRTHRVSSNDYTEQLRCEVRTGAGGCKIGAKASTYTVILTQSRILLAEVDAAATGAAAQQAQSKELFRRDHSDADPALTAEAVASAVKEAIVAVPLKVKFSFERSSVILTRASPLSLVLTMRRPGAVGGKLIPAYTKLRLDAGSRRGVIDAFLRALEEPGCLELANPGFPSLDQSPAASASHLVVQEQDIEIDLLNLDAF